MEKYYLINLEEYRQLDLKEGDVIVFEMPPFCSGEYEAQIMKDDLGLFIHQDDNYFEGCRDYEIRKK